MSLIAHYKLDGDLLDSSGNNNHLQYVNNSGKLVSATGKIGTCYKRNVVNDGADAFRSTNKINLQGDFTMACWAYITACHSGTANGVFVNHKYSANTGAGISIKDISSTDFRISCCSGTGTGRTYNTYYGTTNIKDSWHHLLLRFIKSTNEFSLWVDGTQEYVMTYPQYNVEDYLELFCWSVEHNSASYKPAGSIDDARVYDHALSEKEVKELSKAKILHYDFDDFQEPTENILIDGEVPITSSSYGIKDYYFSTPMIDGETYTVSLNGQLGVGKTYFGLYNSGGSVRPVSLYPSDQDVNGTYTKTFTWTVGSSSNTYLRVYHMLSSTVVDSTINWIQLEKKDHATPFTSSTRAGLVIDKSGYDNHAELELATTPQWTEGSKIGSGAYKFDGTTSGIERIGNFSDIKTISMWVNRQSIPTDSRVLLVHQPTGVGLGFYNNGYLILSSSGNSQRTAIISGFKNNSWNHIAITYSDTKVPTCYINGVETTYSTTNNWTVPETTLYIGRRTSGSAFDGQIDDVRIYATALSADDIKELYQTRASIDNKGNLFCGESNEYGKIQGNNKIYYKNFTQGVLSSTTTWQGDIPNHITTISIDSRYETKIGVFSNPWGEPDKMIRFYVPTTNYTQYAHPTPYHYFIFDKTKTYRFTQWVFMYKTAGTSVSQTCHLGVQGNTVCNVNTTTVNTNPYFTAPSMGDSNYMGKWVLQEFYIYPYGSTGNITSGKLNYTDGTSVNSGSNFNWADASSSHIRQYPMYQYGEVSEGSYILHYRPRLDVIDGTEPSIAELVSCGEHRVLVDSVGTDLITSKNIEETGVFNTQEFNEVGLPIRYIRDSMVGSSANTSNHWVEIQAFNSSDNNIALGKTAVSSILTDGNTSSSPYYSTGPATVDLGDIYTILYLKIWHYWADARTYHKIKTEVSADNINWITVFDSDKDGEYVETSEGKEIILYPNKASIRETGEVFVREIYEV